MAINGTRYHTGYHNHYHSYEVTDYEEFRFVNQDQLLDFHYLRLQNLSVSDSAVKFVRLKYNVLLQNFDMCCFHYHYDCLSK